MAADALTPPMSLMDVLGFEDQPGKGLSDQGKLKTPLSKPAPEALAAIEQKALQGGSKDRKIAGEPDGGKAPRSRSSLDGGMTQFTAFVWIDSNFDGLLNKREKGAPNAKVALFTLGKDGIANNRDDVRIFQGATNALGIFKFEFVRGGAYYLKITRPIGWSVTGWHKGKDGLLGSDAGFGGHTPVFIAYASDGSIEFREKAVPLTRNARFVGPGLPKIIAPPVIAIGLVPRPGAADIPFIAAAATVPLWFDNDGDDDRKPLSPLSPLIP